MAKRMKEKNERNSSKLIFNIFIVLVFLALLGGVFYLSPNYIREDYDGKTKVLINNNNVTLKMKNDVYIDENNNVFLSTHYFNHRLSSTRWIYNYQSSMT